MIPNRKKHALQSEVRKHVEAGSALYTDAPLSYEGLAGEFAHQVVDHAMQYVDGKIHTNGLENFWSLLKRGINGTYVSVEPFHLFRYLDKQAFRYNNRKDMNDVDRFDLAVRQIVGKRLTWNRLTGKEGTVASLMRLPGSGRTEVAAGHSLEKLSKSTTFCAKGTSNRYRLNVWEASFRLLFAQGFRRGGHRNV